MTSGAQIRAARALLNWTQRELAARAHVAAQTVRQFETGVSEPYVHTVEAIEACLENDGIELIQSDVGEGVLLCFRPAAKKG